MRNVRIAASLPPGSFKYDEQYHLFKVLVANPKSSWGQLIPSCGHYISQTAV